jgi:hypothetical protein
MRKIVFLSFTVLIALNSIGQRMYKRPKPKNSFAQGTVDFTWGYNNAAFTPSNMRFFSNVYDFRLSNVRAHDKQTPFSWEYLLPNGLTLPQYNMRVGYNFKDFWNISIGFDHIKYIVRDGQSVNISGFINPGVDPLWSGTFSDGQERPLNKNHFQYQNSSGLNYARIQVSRNLAPFQKFRDGKFAINWLYGISSGALISSTDFTFEGYRTEKVISLSGYGLSLHTGLRSIFFKNIFIQGNFACGILHQVRVQTRPGSNSFASHAFMYGSAEGLLGFLWYLRPTNDCNSCPKW